MNKSFDIYLVMNKLREKRKIFRDENDFRQELDDTIRDMYDNSRVKIEYPAPFNSKKGIDIVVKINDDYYPIELKYKRKHFKGIIDNVEYDLPYDSAQNENSYRIVEDIERIEKFRDNEPKFKKGYTLFLTNDLSYLNEPRENSQYKDFSVHQGNILNGTLTWAEGSSKLEDKKFNSPIILKGTYIMNWKEYSNLDSENGKFMYLINEINR